VLDDEAGALLKYWRHQIAMVATMMRAVTGRVSLPPTGRNRPLLQDAQQFGQQSRAIPDLIECPRWLVSKSPIRMALASERLPFRGRPRASGATVATQALLFSTSSSR
jgi:hypothetical protein